MKKGLIVGLIIVLLGITSKVEARPSEIIDLSGTWQIARSSQDCEPPTAGWANEEVPFQHDGHGGWFWAQRRFHIPEEMAGQRLSLSFLGVDYRCEVRLNGEKLGRHTNGVIPFAYDITTVAKIGEDNLIQILVGSQHTAWKGEGKQKVGYQKIRHRYAETLGPNASIWDRVMLIARPEVYIEEVLISPSFRNKELEASVTINNTGQRAVSFKLDGYVEKDKEKLLNMGTGILVKVAPGQKKVVKLKNKWKNPLLWSHEDPQLLYLVTRLESSGELIDYREDRFGFREFWAEGERFYLNGIPICLRLSAIDIRVIFSMRGTASDCYRWVKDGNINTVRLHTRPFPSEWYDIADEMGILIIWEGTGTSFTPVRLLRDASLSSKIEEQIRVHSKLRYNNPSIVIKSLLNEFPGYGLVSPLHDKVMAKWIKLAKGLDPTRPIMFDSGFDAGGKADIINLHYHHQISQRWVYPNSVYEWFEAPVMKVFDGYGEGDWPWKDKPLIIGEASCQPIYTTSAFSVFFGDEAYLRHLKPYRFGYFWMTYAGMWRFEIEAGRIHRVAGQNPWVTYGDLATLRLEVDPDRAWLKDEASRKTPLFVVSKIGNRPIAVLVRNWNKTFFADSSVERQVYLVNDTLKARQLIFSWLVKAEGKVTFKKQQKVTLPPGEVIPKEISFLVPKARDRSEFELIFTLTEKDKEMFREVRHCSSLTSTKPHLPADLRILLYDPAGKTAQLLDELGIHYTRIEQLYMPETDDDLLILGSQAFKRDAKGEPPMTGISGFRRLSEFVDRGGRILVLDQDVYPTYGFFPVSLAHTEQNGSAMGFVGIPDHPLLKGLEENDLRLWQGDHRISNINLKRPLGSGRSIVLGGEVHNLNTPLLEMPYGKGCYIFSQLLLVDKYPQEPVAQRIFNRLLEYLASYPAKGRETTEMALLISDEKVLRKKLYEIGAKFDVLTEELTLKRLENASVVIVSQEQSLDDKSRQVLNQFVEDGGWVLLHHPSEKILKKLNILPEGASWQCRKSPFVSVLRDNSLSNGLYNEDLYWMDGSPVWGELVSLVDIADFCLTPSLDRDRVQRFSYNELQLPASRGQIQELTHKGQKGWHLRGNVKLTKEVDIPETGLWGITVLAAGTKFRDRYSQLVISIDGKPIIHPMKISIEGRDELTGVHDFVTPVIPDKITVGTGGNPGELGEVIPYTLVTDLKQGKHQIEIAYVNYEKRPKGTDFGIIYDKAGERTLFLAGLEIAPIIPRDIIPLTKPAVLWAKLSGKGGYVVDGLNWTRPEATIPLYMCMGWFVPHSDPNRIRAGRFISALLHNLGVQFKLPPLRR